MRRFLGVIWGSCCSGGIGVGADFFCFGFGFTSLSARRSAAASARESVGDGWAGRVKRPSMELPGTGVVGLVDSGVDESEPSLC